MTIINSDVFVALERKRVVDKALKNSKASKKVNLNSTDTTNASKNQSNEATVSDNRKVVVEDLIFIDDLEVIIYTTVRPRTSTVFITSMQKP